MTTRSGRRVRVLFVPLVFIVIAFSGCFGPGDDEDGLEADVEEAGWSVTVRDADGQTRTYQVTSSPTDADEDQDRLGDLGERLEQTDPRDPDTDDDGLLDGEDVVLENGSRLADRWRDAGIAYTMEEGQIRFLGERSHRGVPTQADTDGDGILDGEEAGGFMVALRGGPTITVVTDVHRPDTDNDGILDGVERRLRLDPTRRDTDGDGVHDRADVNPWRDVHARFVLQNLTLHEVRDVWVSVDGIDEERFLSPLLRAGPDGLDDGPYASETLDPSDDGGSIVAGNHNISFLVTVLRQGGDAPETVDVFGAQTGLPWVEGRLDAVTGDLAWKGPEGGFEPWPSTGFGGAEGSIVLGVETNPEDRAA